MIYTKQTHRPAFSMLELTMVIVVLGILAALAMPRLDRDLRQEAADDILSQIRYTQHLALIDDKHLVDDPKWQRRFWQIMFTTCTNGDGLTFRIGSDNDMDSVSTFESTEAAIDPANGRPLYGMNNNCASAAISPNVFLGKKYGVTAINTSGCNNQASIGFDHLGRPHQGFSGSNAPNSASYMQNNCRFTFGLQNGDTFSIDIAPETGYAHIVGQNES